MNIRNRLLALLGAFSFLCLPREGGAATLGIAARLNIDNIDLMQVELRDAGLPVQSITCSQERNGIADCRIEIDGAYLRREGGEAVIRAAFARSGEKWSQFDRRAERKRRRQKLAAILEEAESAGLTDSRRDALLIEVARVIVGSD